MRRNLSIAEVRAAQGHAAVLTVDAAAELLETTPAAREQCKRWLHDQGLVMPKPWGQSSVVVWGDVVEAIRTSTTGTLAGARRPGGVRLGRAR